MSNRTILLIDYDPQSIEDAIKPLTDAGFTVEVANDGISGLQAFERLHPDLVLIEPMVPKKHGFEVCQEIKGSPHGRGVPVLITTGFYRGRKHHLEAKQFYGCDEYLEKPIAEDLLVSICEKYLAEEPDEPLLLEDLEAAAPATSGVPGEALPELEELSEEEIVARLDALITEEPDPATEQPASTGPEPPQESPDSDKVVFETEPPQFAESAAPVAERTEEEPAPAAESPVDAEEELIPLATPAAVTYGTSGASADSFEQLPLPEEDVAAPEETPPPSRRLWIVAAAAGLLAIAAGGFVLVPRLLRGDDAAQVASAAPRPAATEPAPVREPVAAELSEPSGLPPAAPDAVADETASDSGPAVSPGSSARPAAIPPRPTERRTEPVGRPERKQATPERRADAVRPTTARSSPPPPATSAARNKAPGSGETEETVAPRARESAGSVTPDPVESLAKTSGIEADASSPTVAIADPVAEPPVETAPPPRESPAQPGAADTAEAAPQSPEQADLLTPAADPAPAPEPRIEQPKVARGALLDISEVDAAPVPLDKQPPEYPPLARRLRLEGTVTLRLLVDESGKVQAVETISKDVNNLLKKAAERAGRDWVYRPATKDDVPVKVWIVERLAFRL